MKQYKVEIEGRGTGYILQIEGGIARIEQLEGDIERTFFAKIKSIKKGILKQASIMGMHSTIHKEPFTS